jgi:hypothetical protein
MGGPATPAIGNVGLVMVLNTTLSPASVAPNVSAEQTFTVKGLHIGDYVSVSNSGAAQSGLAITNARVTADSTLGITFGNLTAATITPTASTVYTVFVARCETYPETGSAPSGISA